MSPNLWSKLMLAVIIVAGILYFYRLGRPDIITDESSIATRAIGMVDFDFGIEQPTPWQWIQTPPPWWMRLSFHDHPPLLFLLQNFSMRLLGETPLAIRLPSVLAGLAAVWMVYLIGKQLYSPLTGLASAAIFAFTVNNVWVSRVGLQESITIALMLASAYCFLRGPDTKPSFAGEKLSFVGWWPLSGIFLGLAFLAKYLALILIPIYITLFMLRKSQRPQMSPRRIGFYFLLSIFYFLIIASPVIIYNLQLYRNFGHFDFQFSLFFGQDTPHWPSRPGQEVLGSYAERLQTYIPRLIESNSPYFLALAAMGLAIILAQIILRREDRALVISHSSLVVALAWLLPFIILVGPAHRFLTLLTPWLAIAAGYFIASLKHSNILQNVRMFYGLLAAIVIMEGLYAYSSVIALDPIGSKPWTYSYLRRQAGSWGFNELDNYLNLQLEGKMPETAIGFEFPFSRDLLQKAAEAGRNQGREAVPWGIVYNDNINLSAQLWVFLRRITYQGWPVASAENFRRGGAEKFFREAGIRRVIFINPTEYALQDRTRPPTPDGDILEAALRAKGAAPVEIKNPRGEVTFHIYQLELQ